jgi:hypothetical protein
MQIHKRTCFVVVLLAIVGFTGASLSIGQLGDLEWSHPSPARAADSPAYTAFLPSVSSTFPFQTVFGVEMPQIINKNGLAEVAEAGTTWVRLNGALWADIEPDQAGQRDWSALSSLEEQLKNAAYRGLKVILIVRKTPVWAQKVPGSYCGPIAEEDLAAFGDFLKELVSRYSRHPFNVKYWELWNEPDVDPALADYIGGADNQFGCWGNITDAYYGGGYYGEMLKAVYPKIKEADREPRSLSAAYCSPAIRPASAIRRTAAQGSSKESWQTVVVIILTALAFIIMNIITITSTTRKRTSVITAT